MRRVLVLVALASCSSAPRPAPPPAAPPAARPAPPPAPPATAAPATRSWVGIRIDPNTLRVEQVLRDAPADRAGVRIGDKLVSVDARPVAAVPDFTRYVSQTAAGTPITVVVERGGAQVPIRVTVAARPDSIPTATLVGKPAPAFAATRLEGSASATLADLKGHVVLVDFWATWCGPCTLTIPRLNALHAKYESAGLRIVGLSSEEPETIRPFAKQMGIAYTIAHDPDDAIARDYLRDGIPMFVVIDRAGIVRHVVIGADVAALEAAVAGLMIAP